MQADQAVRKFYAKVMLFGEYSLLAGSKAVTIPWPGYFGQLRYNNDLPESQQHIAHESNSILRQFALFLSDDTLNNTLKGDVTANTDGQVHAIATYLDVNQLNSDLDKGLYFDSDIPTGYGLGSSGALVAAIFERYARLNITPRRHMYPYEMKLLKQVLSSMENFFHATSSGFDPLSCFIGMPLQMHHDEVVVVELHGYPHGFQGGFFLLDTGLQRQTGPLVQEFRKKHQQRRFYDFMRNVYTPSVDAAVGVLLEGDMEGMSEVMYMLSHHQLMHFKEMIPAAFLPLWKNGIKANDYSLKLCGAGGGGFLLGFTNDYGKADNALLPHQLIRIKP